MTFVTLAKIPDLALGLVEASVQRSMTRMSIRYRMYTKYHHVLNVKTQFLGTCEKLHHRQIVFPRNQGGPWASSIRTVRD